MKELKFSEMLQKSIDKYNKRIEKSKKAMEELQNNSIIKLVEVSDD